MARTVFAAAALLLLAPALGLRLGNATVDSSVAPLTAGASSKLAAVDAANAESLQATMEATRERNALRLEGSELIGKMTKLEVVLARGVSEGNASSAVNSSAGRPVPKIADAVYVEDRCRQLFVYANARAICKRMQRRICGKKCERVLPENVTECLELQETLCYVPQMEPAPAPLYVGEVPRGEIPVNVTVCNARRDPNVSALWVAVQGEPARAVVPELDYGDCVQIAGWSHLAIRVYSGPTEGFGNSAQAMGAHFCDKRSSIVMVGASGIDDTQNVMFDYVFEDEGYGRPILCNAVAADKNANLRVTVESTKWYPFVIRGNSTKDRPDGTMQYLECELLALDHADSLEREESLGIWSGKELRAEVPISPVKTLFVLNSEGARGKEEIVAREFNFGTKHQGKKLARHKEMERAEHQRAEYQD